MQFRRLVLAIGLLGHSIGALPSVSGVGAGPESSVRNSRRNGDTEACGCPLAVSHTHQVITYTTMLI
jgi:hypothetical protein